LRRVAVFILFINRDVADRAATSKEPYMRPSLRKSAALLCIGLVITVGLAEPAFAQTANIEGVLQNIVNMLTGNVARLLATLAVIIVGIAWMFGYLDLRKTAYVVLGVAIVFGASEVVTTLTGGQ
jgi:type IV secretory pathway VirB2 component (pilin)